MRRPRVVRTAGSVTEAVYGLILATSVIAVSREYDATNPAATSRWALSKKAGSDATSL